MEEQKELNKVIGTIEPEKKDALEPKRVQIVKINLRDTKKGKILSCECIHPDRDEAIHISSVAYLRDKQVVNSGLWWTLDKDENIQKGSALATFLSKVGIKSTTELAGREVETELDEEKWLCFKAY